MMGNSDDKGSAFIPYTLLTWPNDYFYQLHVYAKDDVNLDQFFSQFKAYAAKMHGSSRRICTCIRPCRK